MGINLIRLRLLKKKTQKTPGRSTSFKTQSGWWLAHIFQTHLEWCFPDWWTL